MTTLPPFVLRLAFGPNFPEKYSSNFGFENQRIVVILARAVDGEVEGTCPDVLRIDNDELVVHDCRAVVRNDWNFRIFEPVYRLELEVVGIGDDADCDAAFFRIGECARHVEEIEVVDADVNGALRGVDEFAESFADMRGGRKIEFDRS